MGIKHFFIWFKKNYGECITTIHNNNEYFRESEVEIDNLCLDLNGIIHPCAQKVYEYGDHKPNKKRLLRKIKKRGLKWQIKLFQTVCDKIDYYRRLVNPKKRLILCIDGVAGFAKMNQQRQRRFRSAMESSEDMDFNTVSITPGTSFMNYLSKYIDWYIRMMITNVPEWRDIEIVFSNEKVAGEGEHKIINYMRKYSTISESYCIQGLDADLIMLSSGMLHPNMYILRENHYNRSELYFLNISLFNEKLVQNMRWEKTETSSRYSAKSAIDDFIFMCFLVGNDFVPTIPTLAILEGGIDVMIDVYKRVGENYGHLTRCRKGKDVALRPKALSVFLGELSTYEKGLLEEKQDKKDCFQPDAILNKHTKIIEGKSDVNFEEYKKDFYDKKFGESGYSIEEICHQYLEGLQWVITYYKKGNPNWNWYFKHFYAPFLCDLSKHSETFKCVNFELGEPVNPFIQLLCVMPPQAVDLLPKPLQPIILSPASSVYNNYPMEFEIDMSGKRRAWEGLVLLPMIDVGKVREEYEKYSKELDKRDLSIISNSNHYLYFYNSRKNYFFKSFYGDVTDCSCSRRVIEF